jgi:hypothetical protein
MKQPGILKPNDDVEMQPFVAQNHGPLPMRYKSFLEGARPDLIEHDDSREIVVWPGRRAVIPHGYFTADVMGKGETRIEYHFGDRAPELKGYRRGYQLRALARPWYKKFSDFFVRG